MCIIIFGSPQIFSRHYLLCTASGTQTMIPRELKKRVIRIHQYPNLDLLLAETARPRKLAAGGPWIFGQHVLSECINWGCYICSRTLLASCLPSSYSSTAAQGGWGFVENVEMSILANPQQRRPLFQVWSSQSSEMVRMVPNFWSFVSRWANKVRIGQKWQQLQGRLWGQLRRPVRFRATWRA